MQPGPQATRAKRPDTFRGLVGGPGWKRPDTGYNLVADAGNIIAQVDIPRKQLYFDFVEVNVSVDDSAVEVRAQGWRTLAALHNRIEAELEKALQEEAALSVVEYTMLSVLSRQPGSWHMRMQQVSRATALSPSATTRLVTRLEDRGLLRRILCMDDRRGIYTELTQTGADLLATAQPVHDQALSKALQDAREVPELAHLVDAVPGLAGTPATST